MDAVSQPINGLAGQNLFRGSMVESQCRTKVDQPAVTKPYLVL